MSTNCTNNDICKNKGCIIQKYSEGCKCYNCSDCFENETREFYPKICHNDRLHSIAVRNRCNRRIAEGILKHNLD